MFFRNLVFLRFPRMQSFGELEAALTACALKPVGPLQLSSRGFIPPMGGDSTELAHSIDYGRAIWITVGGEDRLLPGSVINAALAKKIAEIEEQTGKKPGSRARKHVKDQLIVEMLPQAFVKPSRVDAYIDRNKGFIAIDTSSRKVAENVVSEVRRAIGSFPALPLNAEISPRSILTGWVAGETLADGLSIGDECELRDPVDQGAIVRCQRQALESNEISEHLEAGKQVTRLGLELSDHISFVFGEDLVVRKLKFLDGAVESLESIEADDLRAELDARFALQTGEVRELFDVLERCFKLSAIESTGDGAAATTSPLAAAPGAFDDEADPLLPQAKAFVVESGKTSISYLQRVLKVGYNRAARLIEALEAAGTVSAPDFKGVRRVLPPP